MINCLIIDPMYPGIVELLAEIGVKADHRPDIKPAEVFEIIGNYEGLILRSKMKIDEKLLEAATKIRFIARAGAGVDQIAGDVLSRRKITLLNAPEGNRDAVGEHTLAMLLCLYNNLQIGNKEVRGKKWLREANRGIELFGRTVGIIGYGNMGKATARRLSGFGCKVLTYDINPEVEMNEDAELVPMERIWEEADVLCMHVPLNQSSKFMVDNEYLDKFKKNIHFINLARGEVVSLQTLKYGLESGKLLGLGLDVLENEKLQTLTPEQEEAFDFLCQSDKVIFSPHVGGWTIESYDRINRVLVEKIGKLLKG
ncbi:NAD(P)-dependent oxidoreductase [Flammeovirgaceae bacterium SG7u.111]|nr:NAD(P)-dependent oxidoreductase [Flammeovirgaceae bacterium SG7u.132]WPO35300.1 NAD(P)-dependent oxidoreductase [Flammeovirgaceae bacterium SG7u.111]